MILYTVASDGSRDDWENGLMGGRNREAKTNWQIDGQTDTMKEIE